MSVPLFYINLYIYIRIVCFIYVDKCKKGLLYISKLLETVRYACYLNRHYSEREEEINNSMNVI